MSGEDGMPSPFSPDIVVFVNRAGGDSIMAKTPKVRVIAVHPLSAGSVLASCTVVVGDIVFHGIRLSRHPDGNLMLIPPQIRWSDPDTGRAQYLTLIKWPKPVRVAIL